MDPEAPGFAAGLIRLGELTGEAPAEPVVRALLDRAVGRLHRFCATLLHHDYQRLTHPPLNLQTDELLSAVVERLLKALREARPRTVREFFALAGQHMRWELNDQARRLDKQPLPVELHEGQVPAPASSDSGLSPDGRLVEFAELTSDLHPFFVGTQAHPEFLSRPTRPHPLFSGLIAAAIERSRAHVPASQPRGAEPRAAATA